MRTSTDLVSVRGKSADSGQTIHGGRIGVVVLAGAVGHEQPWTSGLPRPLLPLPGGTLVEALLQKLATGLDGRRAICANGHTELIAGSLACSAAARVHFYEDRLPRGTAGCLKDCATRLDGDTFLVAGGAVWLEDDPAWIVDEHRRQGNTLTVCCSQPKGSVRFGRHRALAPTGVYCCERAALDSIRDSGFQDIKEQLVPALRRDGMRVGAAVVSEGTCEVRTWQEYIRVLTRTLEAELFATQRYDRLAPGIWAAPDVEIAASARVYGPVFLGEGCRVGDRAKIIGPAVFGKACRIGAKAFLFRVACQDDVHVPSYVQVSNRVLRPRTGWRHAGADLIQGLGMLV